MTQLILFLSLLGLSSQTSADDVAEEVAQALRTELENITRRLDESGKIYNREAYFYDSNKTAFYLKSVTLRIRPYVEFEIPGITKLTIRPRFDFRWQRKPPKGWEEYNPK